jgi:hypothetical protein
VVATVPRPGRRLRVALAAISLRGGAPGIVAEELLHQIAVDPVPLGRVADRDLAGEPRDLVGGQLVDRPGEIGPCQRHEIAVGVAEAAHVVVELARAGEGDPIRRFRKGPEHRRPQRPAAGGDDEIGMLPLGCGGVVDAEEDVDLELPPL